jgi:hypothetical protein
MKRPEKVAGHDVSDDAQQHQKNRHPENPTVVHSPPAASVRMTVAMLVTVVLIVHTKKSSILPTLAFLEEKKVRAEPAGSDPDPRFHDSTEISVSLSC